MSEAWRFLQVMDAGVAAEYNTPKELLANKGGVFTSMVNETGRSTAKMLRSVAGGATTMRDTRAALAKSASRTAAQRAPNVNGLQLTQQIVRDTKEADALLQSLVQIMEDQARTPRHFPPSAQERALGGLFSNAGRRACRSRRSAWCDSMRTTAARMQPPGRRPSQTLRRTSRLSRSSCAPSSSASTSCSR